MTLLSSPVEKQGNFLKISFHCLYTKFCLRLQHAKLPEGLMLFPLICIKKQNDYDCDTKENDCLKNQLIYPDKFANGHNHILNRWQIHLKLNLWRKHVTRMPNWSIKNCHRGFTPQKFLYFSYSNFKRHSLAVYFVCPRSCSWRRCFLSKVLILRRTAS